MGFITDKKPEFALWDIVKNLNIEHGIEVFKQVVDEVGDDVPESYILIRWDISTTEALFADGETKLRSSDCDILLVSKGQPTRSTDLHFVNRDLIKEELQSQNIPYEGADLGYDETLESTQYSYSVEIWYQ